jgi:hypothetical protein
MAHEVDLLLSCGCIKLERIEAAIYLPSKGEWRHCFKHDKSVTISRVGNPYHVDETKEEVEIKKP